MLMWKVETASLRELDSSDVVKPLEITLNALASNGWEIHDLLVQHDLDRIRPLIHVVAKKEASDA